MNKILNNNLKLNNTFFLNWVHPISHINQIIADYLQIDCWCSVKNLIATLQLKFCLHNYQLRNAMHALIKKVQSYHICNSWLTAKYLVIFCLIKIAKYFIAALQHIMEILFMKTSKKFDDKTLNWLLTK